MLTITRLPNWMKVIVIKGSGHHPAGAFTSLKNRSLSTNFDPSFDNDPNTYRKLRGVIDIEKEKRLNSPNRFLPISKREDRCDQPIEVCKANSKGRYIAVYRGCTVIKTAEELQIYHQLFWYL